MNELEYSVQACSLLLSTPGWLWQCGGEATLQDAGSATIV